MSIRTEPVARAIEAEQGRTLAYFESGAGEPVIFLHSGGFSSRQWRRLAQQLAASHRAFNVDLLGYGASTPIPLGTPIHLDDDLRAIERLLATLTSPAHLVGHSYGGLLAAKLALAHPAKVQSLALYEPVTFGVLDPVEDAAEREALGAVEDTYRPDPKTDADEGWLRGFIEWWNGAGAWDRLGDETRAAFRAVGWKMYREVSTILADPTTVAEYATLAAPTLVLGGGQSPATEQRVVARLAAQVKRGEKMMFPELGHMGPIVNAPRVNAAIAAHVQAHSRQ